MKRTFDVFIKRTFDLCIQTACCVFYLYWKASGGDGLRVLLLGLGVLGTDLVLLFLCLGEFGLQVGDVLVVGLLCLE